MPETQPDEKNIENVRTLMKFAVNAACYGGDQEEVLEFFLSVIDLSYALGLERKRIKDLIMTEVNKKLERCKESFDDPLSLVSSVNLSGFMLFFKNRMDEFKMKRIRESN